MDFKQRIMEMRKQHGYSRQQLADLLGVAPRTIASWENGEREPSFGMLVTLSDFYAVSADYLLCRTDDPVFVRRSADQVEISTQKNPADDPAGQVVLSKDTGDKLLTTDQLRTLVYEMVREAFKNGTGSDSPVG